MLFFSQLKIFSKYLYYYLIFQTKKVYIPRHHFRKCNSHCHFLRHSQIIYFLYFYIFAFFYAQRLFCSSQILFHWQFPQISLRLSIARIFSWTFFVNSLKCNVCPAFSPHFSSTALSYYATLSPASQCPPRLFGQAKQISSVST